MTGCMSPEERRIIYAKKQQAQQLSIDKVRRELRESRAGRSRLEFKIRSNKDFFNVAHRYVSELGGTVISRGNSNHFILKIDYSREYDKYYIYYHISATITSIGDRNGSDIVLFSTKKRFSCFRSKHSSCKIYSSYVWDTLTSF